MVHELLSGTYDLHIHTAPDVIPRKCTDEETVRRLEAAGMRGCAIKCHYFETAARAALLQEHFSADENCWRTCSEPQCRGN